MTLKNVKSILSCMWFQWSMEITFSNYYSKEK